VVEVPIHRGDRQVGADLLLDDVRDELTETAAFGVGDEAVTGDAAVLVNPQVREIANVKHVLQAHGRRPERGGNRLEDRPRGARELWYQRAPAAWRIAVADTTSCWMPWTFATR
jgi:hypothetical protein